MAGVPVRAVDTYLAKAIAGRTITIASRSGPARRGGIVKRAIVRTITPGTVIEPHLLEDGSNNYLAALCVRGDRAGLARRYHQASSRRAIDGDVSGPCS